MWPKFSRQFYPLVAIALLVLGTVLLAGGVSYFIYSWKAHSDLDSLTVTAPDADYSAGLISQRQNASFDLSMETSIDGPSAKMSREAIAAQTLYPGEVLNPPLWSNPLAEDVLSMIGNPTLEGFLPVDLAALPSPGHLPSPTRISIPAIEVDSEVQGLQILDLGDSRAYETPKDVVGHIPETANAGELGTAWFFGHLESPIRGEGSVFRNLPKIPPLLEQGVDVYVTVENGESTFLYKLTSSKVVHEDDLIIHEVGGASIVLVTCVPRFDYNKRLVITGELVGIKG